MTNRFPQLAVHVLALALLYFVTGWLGLMLPAFGSHVTLLWMPSGIAVAALLRCGFRCWPGVALGAFAVNYVTGIPWLEALGISAGNTAGPLLAAWLLQRMAVRTTFDRRRDILLLTIAAFVGMTVSASVGVAMLSRAGVLMGGRVASWLVWWAGDAMGIVAAAPLLLCAKLSEWRAITSRLTEFLIWVCTTSLIAFVVFFVPIDVSHRGWVPSYVTLPMIAWAAMRFGKIGTSIAIILISSVAASATGTGQGPFYRPNATQGMLLLWLYMSTCAALGWLITALQAGRAKAIGMQALFDRALSEISLGVLISDLDGRILYANEGFTRLTGYTEEEMMGRTCGILQGPQTDPRAVKAMRAAVRGGGFYDGEVLNYRKDGTTFWNGVLITPIHNERNERTGFLGISRSITDRREAELARNESESRIRRIVEYAPEAILLFDPVAGHFLQANPAAERLFKLSAAELCRVGPVNLSPPTQPDGYLSSEKAADLISQTLAGGAPVFEWSCRSAEGFDIPCEVRLLRIEVGGRNVLRCSVTDITERRKVAEALKSALGFANSLFDSMQDGFSLLDAKGVQKDVNPAFCRMTGFSRGELIGRSPPYPYWPPEEHDRIRAALGKTINGDFADFELTFVRKNGERFPVIVSPSGIKNKDGEFINYLATVKDITERKRAEEALSVSAEFNRSLIGSMQDGFVVLGLDGMLVDVNPALCDMTGFSREELIGRNPPFPYWPPEEMERIQAAVGETFQGRFATYELTYMRKNGERFPVVISPSGVKNKEGVFVNYVATLKDITERKRAEEALRLADQKLKLHFEQTPMAVIEWDLEFRVTNWNPAAERIFGFSREEARGRHAAFIVPEKFRGQVDEVWRGLLKKSGGERSSNENVRKDGAGILCEWYNTPLIDGRGKVTGVASLVMDITERRHAQQLLAWEKNAMELISSPASLRDVLEGLMYGLEKQAPPGFYSVLVLDEDGIHLRHGAAPSLPEAYNRLVDGIAIGPAVGSCGTAAYADRQIIVSDIASDPRWAEYREVALGFGLRACWSTPIRGSLGKMLGTFAVYYQEPRKPLPSELDLIARASNIIRIAIERKRAEEALRESEEKFRTLFENAGDAILLMQGELFVDCNARTLEMFGCESRGQIVGRPPYELSPPLQPAGRSSIACAVEKINAALAGRRQFFEWMHSKLDGTPFPAEVTLNTVIVGGQVMLQAVVRDISERKRAEEQIRMLTNDLERRVEQRTAELQAANREMEAFSYSVSHDLRAPLRAVDGFSRIVAKNYAEKIDEEGRRMLDLVRGGAQQMGRLIDDLLAFSRLGRVQMEPVPIDMHAMARAVFDEQAAHEPGRKLHLLLHPLPVAHGTQAMIRQVWVNLISNAIKFTGKREVAEIEIGARLGEEGEEGEQAYYVKDNGAGFDMRHVARLFGVFQRLHGVHEFEGTGVGLALVQRIVQRHGGRVWAEGRMDQGATFSFTLSNPKT